MQNLSRTVNIGINQKIISSTKQTAFHPFAKAAILFLRQLLIKKRSLGGVTFVLNKGKPPWGDIVCQECHFVIATISASESGVYQFRKVAEVPSLAKCVYPKMVIGFGLLFASIVTVIGTRGHHATINPSLTEAQALVFYSPLWLCAIGLAVAGYVVLKTYLE